MSIFANPLLLHWGYAAIFAVMGFILLFRSNMVAAVPGSWRRDSAFEERVEEALCRRRRLEDVPVGLRVAPSILCFVIAALTAFSQIPPGVLYGVLMFGISIAMAGTFLQLKNRGPVRAAMLSPRSSSAVIPAYWFVLAIVDAVTALAGLQVPGEQLGSVFVCVSTLVCTVLAWRITEMRALLTGDDPQAEEFVDSRVRFNRSAGVLFFAFAQSYVFLSGVLPVAHSRLVASAQFTAMVLVAIYIIWYLIALFQKSAPRNGTSLRSM
jgi:hypothetical protein